MDALERVEVTIRTQLAYQHAHFHGSPFAYAEDPMALLGLTLEKRGQFLNKLEDDIIKAKPEIFAKHFFEKYGDIHRFMPVWMAAEIMSFGCVLTFFRGCHPAIQKKIASIFGVTNEVLDSWILTFNVIRNICAHHGRLWNRELGVRPKIPRKDLGWHNPIVVCNDRMFGILTLLKHCLNIVAPQSHWPERMMSLLSEFPEIPLHEMGFPDDWQDCAIWKTLDRGK